MKILFSDPRASYYDHRQEIDRAIAKAMESGWYILGSEVAAFEKEFATYVGASYAVGVANGTDALEIALKAAGVRAGDGVFTVSHTAVATVSAIERCGAVPLLIDIDPKTYCMDFEALKERFDEVRQSAVVPKYIIPVHIYGHPAPIKEILAFAKEQNLTVIEDCAQAHGAAFAGKTLGSLATLGAYSFYPTKNLGAFGDGGAVVTSDPEIFERLKSIREYGWKERYISAHTGINSRLDELHAAMLRVKLNYLTADNDRRIAAAKIYNERLKNLDLALPAVLADARHVFHLYVVRSARRELLVDALKKAEIGFGIHYPMPIHLQPGYAHLSLPKRGLRATEVAAKEILSLPMYPQLTEAQINHVCDVLEQALRS